MRDLAAPLSLTALVLLAATGLDWNANMTWYDEQRIDQIALLGVMALLALTVWRHDALSAVASLPSWATVAFASAFGLGLLSAATSTYPRFAILEWATLLLLVQLALLLAVQSRRAGQRFDRWALWLVVSLATVIALKIIAGYLAAVLAMGHVDTILLFAGTFSNRRFFGQVASLAVPLLAYPLLKDDLPRAGRGGLFALLTLWWVLIFASGTRGTWVALGLAALAVALLAWQASKTWFRLQGWAAISGALLFWIMFSLVPDWLRGSAVVENRFIDLATLSGRAQLWDIAWTRLMAHPWLGIGPMHFAAIHNKFGAHPHNALLQLAVEWGIPAAIGLAVPVAWGLVRMLSALRRAAAPSSPLLVCLTASLMAGVAQSMVDGMIVVPYTQIWLVLVAGWAFGVCSRNPVGSPESVGWPVRLGVPAFTLLALVFLLKGVYPEILNRTDVTPLFTNIRHPLITPRYWAVGSIP